MLIKLQALSVGGEKAGNGSRNGLHPLNTDPLNTLLTGHSRERCFCSIVLKYLWTSNYI